MPLSFCFLHPIKEQGWVLAHGGLVDSLRVSTCWEQPSCSHRGPRPGELNNACPD